MRRSWLVVLGLLLLPGCKEKQPDYVSPVTFDTARAWIRTTRGDSVPLLVEVAATDAQRTFGLMARPSLDSTSGMVFAYDTLQSPKAGFWMWRTKMPLDIAFMDSTGVMLRLITMEPCASEMYAESCETYIPNVAYRSALEVNGGFFAKHGVGEGSQLGLDTATAR